MRVFDSLRFHPRLDHLECRTVPSVVPINALVLGAGAGADPVVSVIDPTTNREAFRFLPFEPTFRGGVSVAVGDLVGDDAPDIAVAAASDGGPRVAVYDGGTGEVVRDFFVYEPSFRGGVTVAIGDIDGDGDNDLVTGTGAGGGPRVTVIDVATGNTIRNFFAFEDSFRGGVNVGSDDVNGDGFDDIVVGTGVGGAPRVQVFSGDDTGNVLLNFFAYDSSFRNGVNVSAADIDADGRADVLVGAGTGGAPHVRVIAGADGRELQNFIAFDDRLRGGARVAAVDDGDAGADTLVVGTPGHLRRFFRAVDGSEIAEDVAVLDVSRGVFLGGRGDDGSRGRGDDSRGRGDLPGDRRVDESLRNRAFAGEIAAVNPDLGTVTIRTGPTGTLAVFPIADGTRLVLDGEAVDDLTGFAAGDVALIQIGSDRRVSALVAATADAEPVAPPAGRTLTGAVVAADAGTLTVLTRTGAVFLVEADAGTVFVRNGDSDAGLADFAPGDLVEARIGSDGFANRVATVSGRPIGGGGDDNGGRGGDGSSAGRGGKDSSGKRGGKDS